MKCPFLHVILIIGISHLLIILFERAYNPGGGGGTLNVEVTGMLVGNFFGEP